MLSPLPSGLAYGCGVFSPYAEKPAGLEIVKPSFRKSPEAPEKLVEYLFSTGLTDSILIVYQPAEGDIFSFGDPALSIAIIL